MNFLHTPCGIVNNYSVAYFQIISDNKYHINAPSFKDEHFDQAKTSRPVQNLAQGQAPWFPHSWLEI